MHPEALAAVDRLLTEAGVDRTSVPIALDIGGRDINGTARAFLPHAVWRGLDIVHDPGVDIVADATKWRSGYLFDVIVCTELLEHVEGWRDVIRTIWYHTAPTGIVIITCASDGRRPHGAAGAMWPEEGEYYGNVGPTALRDELDRYFDGIQVEYNPNPGDAYALATLRRPTSDHDINEPR